jgi:hypothetical protein
MRVTGTSYAPSALAFALKLDTTCARAILRCSMLLLFIGPGPNIFQNSTNYVRCDPSNEQPCLGVTLSTCGALQEKISTWTCITHPRYKIVWILRDLDGDSSALGSRTSPEYNVGHTGATREYGGCSQTSFALLNLSYNRCFEYEIR